MSELDLTTRLALERTKASVDRSLMSWVRTATSLITFGFSVYKFFQLDMNRPESVRRVLIGSRQFSLLMVCLGLSALLLGSWEHWAARRRLKAIWLDMPKSWSGALAAAIWALGVVALLAVVFRE